MIFIDNEQVKQFESQSQAIKQQIDRFFLKMFIVSVIGIALVAVFGK